jgi:hypothetical protein
MTQVVSSKHDLYDEWWGTTCFKEMEQITGYRQSDFSSDDGFQDFVDACDAFWATLSIDEKAEKWNLNK